LRLTNNSASSYCALELFAAAELALQHIELIYQLRGGCPTKQEFLTREAAEQREDASL